MTARLSRVTAVWTLIGIVLLTANLRAAITGVSPLLDEIRTIFGVSGIGVGVLTTLPVLCLGVFAALAPVLARRLGAETVIAGALVMITAGIALRVVPSPVALFTGTVLAGAGIAMGNVLTPAVIKRAFPRRVGTLTGLVMMLMASSGAIAAGLAVPLEQAGGWRLALAVWAVPSAVAALVWGPLALRGRRTERSTPARPTGGGSLLRTPLAWYVTGFMGLCSMMFYVLASWLPEIMRDHGYGAAEAGTMVSVLMIIGIPLGYAVPVIAGRLRDQRPVIAVVAAAMAAGLSGLLLAPEAGWVWVIVLGLGTGSAFPLGYTLLSLRAPTPLVAARLSGMAQCGGYMLAATGPLAVGVLHSVTGGWEAPIGLLIVLVVPEIAFGWLAARPGHVHAPEARTPATEPAEEPLAA